MRKPKPPDPIIEAANAESIEAIDPMAMPAGLPRKSLKPADEDDPTGALGPRKPVPIPPDAKWINAKQVCARYGGRSLMWLERKLKHDQRFPKATYFGPLRYWQPPMLDAYDDFVIKKTLTDRDARAPAKENANTAA